MEKKIVFISLIVALLAIASIYVFQTYAVEEQDISYEITLSGDTTVKVPSNTYKDIIYQIKNNNNGTVKYSVGYNGNAIVKAHEDSIDPASGLIEKNSYKNIKLRIENRSEEEAVVELSTLLGFVNGGKLNVPEGTSIVSDLVVDNDIIKNTNNELYFYTEELSRDKIESIEYKTFSDIPNGMNTIDISKEENNSVRLWYTDNNGNNLYEVYIASFTGKIVLDEDASGMFKNITNISEFNLLSIDTSNVINMSSMFSGCVKLEKIDLSSFDTSKVTNMDEMFKDCSSLSVIDLKNFSSDKLLSMNKMFNGCSSLNKIDLRNFEFGKIKVELDEKLEIEKEEEKEIIKYSGVFKEVPNNCEIIIKDCIEYEEFTKNWGNDYTNLITMNNNKCESL